MAWLNADERERVRARLRAAERGVHLAFFTQETACPSCRESRQIVEDVAALSDDVRLTVLDLRRDEAEARRYRIDKLPAIVIEPEGPPDADVGIRYYGVPAGYEFNSLLEDILMVSSGDSGLADQTRIVLKDLQREVHLQVFVTPTCPYCAPMIRLAHQLAMESPWIRADAVEAIEFPHLTVRYGVMGLPRTVINDELDIDGAVPEATLVTKVLEAARRGHRRVAEARALPERDIWR